MANGGILALPAAALAAVALTTAPPVGDGAAGTGARVELEVAGFLPIPQGTGAILVLREKGARTLLPLVVPGAEPPGHVDAQGAALLGQAIEALGGKVSEVEIDRAEETRAGARVRVAQGGRQVELRARPSESIALALFAEVPIVTTRRVLDEDGLTPEDLERAHAKAGAKHERM